MSTNCPTCGPTVTEQHPRLDDVLRCANCKEWLSDAASTPDPMAGEAGGCFDCPSLPPPCLVCPRSLLAGTPASEGLTEDLAPVEECIDPADLMEAMVHAGAWAMIESTTDTADREPSRELYEQTVADVRKWLAARVADAEAKARADERGRIARVIRADALAPKGVLHQQWAEHFSELVRRRGDA